jgi:hypothetical protein
MSSPAEARQREKARQNTRMRFEQWAQNPTCEANTISAVRNVRMADVAKTEGLTPTFGQSPFALVRGERFEKFLFFDSAVVLINDLIEKQVLPHGATGLADFRLKMNGGQRVTSLDEALNETESFLNRVAHADSPKKRKELPAVVAGATLRIPRGVMLPEAILILDALVVRADGDRPILIVGEVKTYPDRGGHTDAHELAVARAQAGIYVHALDVVCEELGISESVEISRDGFLVLTRPGSNRPSIRPREDLRYQAERAARGFELLEDAAQRLPAGVWALPDAEPPDELVNAITEAGVVYSEACLSFCDRASGCHRRALEAGDPLVLGQDVQRFLGTIDLHRAMALIEGAPAETEADADLLRRIQDSDRTAQL